MRYSNFYNNYNIDWHAESQGSREAAPDPRKDKCTGVTTDGKNPCCPPVKKEIQEDKGCPTGDKIFEFFKAISFLMFQKHLNKINGF